MSRDYQDYLRAVFKPLVDACDFQPEHCLKTLGIEEERRQEQFNRFKSIKVDDARASPIATGGFVAIAIEGDTELLLVCAPTLNDQEVSSFEEFLLKEYDWTSAEFDEATLLVVAKELPGLLKLSSDYRNSASALNFLDIIDDDYAGHDLKAVMDVFHSVLVFEISADNAYHGKDISEIVLKLAAASLNYGLLYLLML